jgi:hypothetical protein
MIYVRRWFNQKLILITYENKVMIKRVPKTGVEQTKSNGRSYPYLYPIGDLINSELKVN